jgi:2-polyprenyl-6-methoxyphenol hydroxylase-like FAD-dependent oxidoreductase
MPGFDPFPRRDLGRYTFYSMSRPLLEQTLRLHVQRKDNVRIEEKYRVRAIEVNSASASVCGVEGEMANGRSCVIPSTLVVDASGHGALTLRLLEKMALPQPERSTIGVDISYRTAILTLPGFIPDWKGAMTFPELAASTRGANLVPLEGNRWIFGLRGSHGDSPPADWEAYLEYASQLRTTTLFEVLKRAKREGEVAPYLFAESLWRHFERLKDFPQGILPLGDVICRLNPLAAQGLSIAAKEALLLGDTFESLANEREPLARLAPRFFQAISGMIQDCWSAVALNDFVHPKTRGQRPIDFAARRNFKLALISLAALDPQIHGLLLDVDDLLKPLSALNAPEIAERVRSIQRADSRGDQSATMQAESPRDPAVSVQI